MTFQLEINKYRTQRGNNMKKHTYTLEDFDAATLAYMRAVACAPGESCPVKLLPGEEPPHTEGQSAYSTRHSKGNYCYHPSTRHIIVGVQWLLKHQAFYKSFATGREAVILVGNYAHYTIYDNGYSYVVCDGDRVYHSNQQDLRAAAHQAKENFDRQDLVDIAATLPLDNVWVMLEDSLDAGNCEPESRKFKEVLISTLGATGDIGAVRATTILNIRDDGFTRRACQQAALRTAGIK